MAPCLPHSHSTNEAAVGERRKLLLGLHREDILGQERLQGLPAAHPSGSAQLCSSARLPTCTGSVPSPSQRRRLDGLPVSPLPQPTSVLLSLFLSSNKVTCPCSSPRVQHHQPGISLPGPASGSATATAAELPSAELAVSTRSSHLTPARRMLRAVRSPQKTTQLRHLR